MRSTLSMMRLLAIAAVATAYRPATAGREPSSRLVPVPRCGRLVATKPKPLLKEAAIDLSIMGAAQLFFRRTHCTNAGTCELPRAVVSCRAFFVTVQSYLLAIYVRQLGVARSMKQSAVVKEDLFRMRVRLSRAAVKAVFLLAIHLHFGLMPPLVVSCVTAVVALPYWWDRESSYLGRNHISWRLHRDTLYAIDASSHRCLRRFLHREVRPAPRPAGMDSVCGSIRNSRRLRLIPSRNRLVGRRSTTEDN